MLLSLILFSFLGSQVASTPSTSSWQMNPASGTQARLRLSHSSVSKSLPQVYGGLEFKLKKNWHIYWKNARSVGLAPRVRLDSSSATLTSFLFPFPETIVSAASNAVSNSGSDGATAHDYSYGYKNTVLFPFVLERLQSHEALSGRLTIDYLVCHLQCIPESFTFTLTLPLLPRAQPLPDLTLLESQIFALSQTLAPDTFESRRLNHREIQLTFRHIAIEALAATRASESLVSAVRNVKTDFVSRDPHTWILTHDADNAPLELWIQTKAQGKRPSEIFSTRLNLAEPASIPAAGPSPRSSQNADLAENLIPPAFSFVSFLLILFTAFLGGFILNLMPCVLPVVLLKTTGILKLRHQKKDLRRSLMGTTAGILCSFVVLALVVIAMRSAGQSIGWGFQFQNAAFLLFLLIVLAVFAFNLLGLFEFSISSRSTTHLASWRGPFAEGMLATVLATPCSAPFLGTALTFALGQTAPWLLLTFFMMGLGLASPYLLLMLAPTTSFLSFLPKPGPWMETLKRLLAYSLLISALWIFSVFVKLVSPAGIILALGIFAASFVLLKELPLKVAFVAVVLISGLGLFEISTLKRETSSAISSTSVSDLYARLDRGEKLFVVVTADWCLTCKVNEETVIKTEWFQKALREHDLTLYTLDWTQADPTIADFLRAHNRVAIPFAALMSRNKNEHSILLPELLTRTAVEKALKEFNH